MWPDNETGRDFLNFTGVANTVAEIIANSQGQPVSIGVSGAWGVGKSSMIRLIKTELAKKEVENRPAQFVFVEFNAWLYQGYDDARAALMEVIAQALAEEAKRRCTKTDKITDLLKRVKWFRLLKLGVGTAVPLLFGLPPVGPLAELYNFGKKAIGGDANKEELKDAGAKASELAETEFIREKSDSSPPKEIHALRAAFEEALRELQVTLVVLIDDLDRCLPPTTISTLEAIRLFLFMDKAAFVIAADTEMIKHAVRKHFEGLSDDNMVTSYFDKLIQIPLRVPPLGTQEVRAYMMLLFAERAGLAVGDRDMLRIAICKQLSESWRGKRVDRALVEEVLGKVPAALAPKLEMAERLAPIMTTATGIAGNPRLIKRFLNALSIRMSIAQVHGVDVDETVLAKLLLFERLGDPKAYLQLLRAVTEDSEGKAAFLVQWEDQAKAGTFKAMEAPWKDPFVGEWLTLPPALGNIDLRGALYVGREHAPLISPEDNLSPEGAELLAGLITSPKSSGSVIDNLKKLPQRDLTIIMDRVLERARREDEWGTPAILDACIAIADAAPSQGERLGRMLRERPLHQIKASIVPRIGDRAWARDVLSHWESADVAQTVKKAIQARKV
jgi:predicted KAP-like P-loop ATPase